MRKQGVTLKLAVGMNKNLHYWQASWDSAAYHLHPYLQKAAFDHFLWTKLQITKY